MAREVTTDAADNMSSIHKIVDRFDFELNRAQLQRDGVKLGVQEIGLPANYAVATSWLFGEKLKKETFLTFKITILDPKGQKLGDGPEQENLLPAGIEKFNMNFNVQGLPVTSEGTYKLQAEVISKEGKSLAKADYPFQVVFGKQA